MAGAQLIEIRIDEAKLRSVQRMLADIPHGLDRAVTRALNRTEKSSRAEIVRQIGAVVTAPLTDIRNKIQFSPATWKRWSATIKVWGKRISLSHFRASQTRKGVAFTIQKGGTRGFIPSGFKIEFAKGHRHSMLFRRLAKGSPSGKVGVEFSGKIDPTLLAEIVTGRLPIEPLYGPSPGAILQQAPGLLAGTKERIGGQFEREIDAQVKFLLRGKTG